MYCTNCLNYFTIKKTKRILPEYFADIIKNKEQKREEKEIRYCKSHVWCSNKCYKKWCNAHNQCLCKYKNPPRYCNLIKKFDKKVLNW